MIMRSCYLVIIVQLAIALYSINHVLSEVLHRKAGGVEAKVLAVLFGLLIVTNIFLFVGMRAHNPKISRNQLRQMTQGPKGDQMVVDEVYSRKVGAAFQDCRTIFASCLAFNLTLIFFTLNLLIFQR
jgi:hypothetical protein